MQLIPKLVIREDNVLFMALPTLDEIKDAIFSMPDDSAPCLDGYIPSFYKACMYTITPDMLKAIT